jgi:hypothetical protein
MNRKKKKRDFLQNKREASEKTTEEKVTLETAHL